MAGQTITQAVANQPHAGSVAEARAARMAILKDHLDKMAPEIARALPAHMTADRLARIVLTQVRKTPDLALCTAASMIGAVLNCAQMGLEPGPTGEAFFIPRKNKQGVLEAHFELGYKGMASLFWRHPLAAYLSTGTVHVNDDFEYEGGTAAFLRHKPADDRGALRGLWFAVFRLGNGGYGFTVLNKVAVERRRRASSQPNGVGWSQNYNEMAEKSALRDMFDLMPKSAEISRVLAWDGAVRTDLSAEAIDTPPDREPQDPVDDEPGEPENGDIGENDGWPPGAKPGAGGEPA